MRSICRHLSTSTLLALALACQMGATQAATFTYHGNLQDSGRAAEGSYDLELTLYSAPSGGSAIGGPLTLNKVPVHVGSFSVEADFGPLTKNPGQAWLSVKVRKEGNVEFAALSARSLVSSSVASSVCPGAWTLDGNAGTAPGTGLGQNYLGTADNQSLVLAVNGQQAAQLIPSTDLGIPDSTNVVLGSPGNSVAAGVGGATISGGGSAFNVTCGPSSNQPCVNSATAEFASVGGGVFNLASGLGASVDGGGYDVAAGAYATIAGGSGGIAGADWSTVGGGYANMATQTHATVSGGNKNTASGDTATVAGGDSNTASGGDAVVSGGNSNMATGYYANVSGGKSNTASGYGATVCGGDTNTALGTYAIACGGSMNNASYDDATVSGGYLNVASGLNATIGGGHSNSAQGVLASISGGYAGIASGYASTVAGGYNNQAGGDYSFAAGDFAHVRNSAEADNPAGDDGTFVWADDSTGVNFSSTGPHQFLVQSTGGVGINGTPVNANVELTIVGNGNLSSNYSNVFLRQSGLPAGYLVSAGDATSGNNNAAFYVDQFDGTNQTRRLALAANGDFTVSAGAFKPGGGTWSTPSDARLKKDVRPLEQPLDQLLQLRGVSFEYLRPDDGMHPGGRHNGFIAQEVQGIFPEWVGTTPDGYLSVGPTGFEALSVEAFRQLRDEKDAQIAELHSQLDDLSARLARLESAKER